MKIVHLLRKISGTFFDNSKSLFRYNYNDVKCKIDAFPEPINDMERALFHYKCTMEKLNYFQRFLLNFGSLILYYPYFIKLTHSKIDKTFSDCDALFYTGRISLNIVPESLKKRYPHIECLSIGEKMSLTAKDKVWLKKIRKEKPFCFYFHFKIMLKLAMLSYGIQAYRPKAIISYTESSFATSLLTEYCENKNIKNIGVMHGERLYSLKLAFFRCTEYYAWDQDYVDLFCSMRCEKKQFRVEKPEAVMLPKYQNKQNKKYHYTFYLQEETSASIKELKKICSILVNSNFKIVIRPHPEFCNIDWKHYFPGVQIQDSKKVSLEESLSETEAVISRNSTVLYQAFYLKIPVIIDDCTIPEQFKMLQNLQYIMLKKEHALLSEVLKRIKSNKKN